jgi:hypothetical protein
VPCTMNGRGPRGQRFSLSTRLKRANPLPLQFNSGRRHLTNRRRHQILKCRKADSRDRRLRAQTGQSHFYLFGEEGEIRTRERVVPLPVSPALYTDCLGERVGRCRKARLCRDGSTSAASRRGAAW